jgi:hypothetical protein
MSKTWFKKTAGSLDVFMKLVEDKWQQWASVKNGTPSIWFRGHANARWPLVPGLYRAPFKASDEDVYRHEFQLRACPFLAEATYQPTNMWEWYFLMQHHGLPTRLLDWTESSLVAMFFALVRGPEEADGAVWLMDPFRLNTEVAQIGDLLSTVEHTAIRPYLWKTWANAESLPPAPAAFEPAYNSRRIAVQRGRFTTHGSGSQGIESYEALHDRLAKIVIPAESKDMIRRQLSMAGVTEGVIFPGLVGLSREIVEEWSHEYDIRGED